MSDTHTHKEVFAMARVKKHFTHDSMPVLVYHAGSTPTLEGYEPARGVLALGMSHDLVRMGVETLPRSCWRNAVLAQGFLAHEYPDALYVEGWVALPSGLVLDHGWVRMPGDALIIVDTTMTLHAPHSWAGATYCEGATYTPQQAMDALGRGQPPFVWNRAESGAQTPKGGFWHPGYRRAHHQACLASGTPSPWKPEQLA
jgi:hypothetical protein